VGGVAFSNIARPILKYRSEYPPLYHADHLHIYIRIYKERERERERERVYEWEASNSFKHRC
jgi:hypothetical protein